MSGSWTPEMKLVDYHVMTPICVTMHNKQCDTTIEVPILYDSVTGKVFALSQLMHGDEVAKAAIEAVRELKAKRSEPEPELKIMWDEIGVLRGLSNNIEIKGE